MLPKKSSVLLYVVFASFLNACASGPTPNDTAFPYEIEAERLASEPIKTVVVPHINLGAPSRTYLEEAAPRVDAEVTRYLKDNGYTVVPQREFRQHWNTAERAFGNPVDPTTGRVNMKTFSQIMQSVRDRFAEERQIDAFVFTDLVELDVPFNGGLKHVGRWDGVTRRPALQGPGNSVSADFDWGMLVSVASLQITIFDSELKRLFVSRGGLDSTDAVDTRSSSGRYIRRRNILENDTHVTEGVQLAFHPLIEMKNYPGQPSKPSDGSN